MRGKVSFGEVGPRGIPEDGAAEQRAQDADQRAQTWRLIEASTAPEADVVAVHWRPKPEDAWLSGEAVQRELNDYLTDAGWCRVVTHTDVEFVVATWSRDVPLTIGR